jgi:hypothetical protein
VIAVNKKGVWIAGTIFLLGKFHYPNTSQIIGGDLPAMNLF